MNVYILTIMAIFILPTGGVEKDVIDSKIYKSLEMCESAALGAMMKSSEDFIILKAGCRKEFVK
jgi:hypothetical protein